MKRMRKPILLLALSFVMTLAFSACSEGNNTSVSTFPHIDDREIPDILEKTVGVLGDTYFTSFGATDNKDYQSYLAVTFENTTEEDYTALMKHYQSATTGTDENGLLLFDWGQLQVTADETSIIIHARIIS